MKKFRLYILFFFVCTLIITNTIVSQVVTNKEALMKISMEKAIEYNEKRAQAELYAKEHNIPITFENDKGVFFELQYISEYDVPMYYKTDNSNAAKTISTNKVYQGGGVGLSLDGTGITPREWDGGGVRLTHQEYGGRVTQGDNPSSTHWHSTHVAGTIMAAGVQSSAKGMAYNANLRAFDWNADNSEMAAEAAAGALVSNHSYGFGRGWSWTGGGWTWHGTPSISNQEDYLFGFYESKAKNWDVIAANAPYYLIVKSAGNDRNEGPHSGQYPKDGPYDCIAHGGIAKNVLTVGAVHDIPGGYSGPGSVNMSSFSSWGPADDGRVKPDIVANGIGLYSTSNSHNSSYTSSDGTSMSAPSATGSLVLLQEHWEDLKGAGEYMTAATLKGLVIHTADEAGTGDGPDYKFGWGLMNTKNAALRISEDENFNVIDEIVINNGSSFEMVLISDGTEDLKVTICWTDVPGQPVSPALDPTNPMLVNDLDLKIMFDGNTYYPWKLNRNSPSSIATNNTENDVDNVEVVFIENPTAGEYTVLVDHDGLLSGGSQAFSIIIGGVTNTISLPSAFAGADMNVCEGSDAQLDGGATNYSSIMWSTEGDGTFDNPEIVDAIYTPGANDIEAGSVELELTANALPPTTGSTSDTIIITIVKSPIVNAGSDITTCGNTSVQLAGIAENHESIIWASRGDGTFDNTSILDAVYTLGPTDIDDGEVKLSLIATAIEPCTGEFKDVMHIYMAATPKSDAGVDGITCGNMAFQMDGSAQDNEGVEWSTSGDGTFDDISILNPTYTPGTNDISAGTVNLSLTAFAISPCTTDSTDFMVLTVEGMPNIAAGDDDTTCSITPYQLTGVVENPHSVEWTTTGDGNFADNTALSTTYTPGTLDIQAGNTTLKLTAYFTEGCEEGFDEILLDITPNAVAYAGPNDSVCKGGTVTLAGEAENSSSIKWSSFGDGIFANPTLLTSDYTPGSADISNGEVVLQLSVYPKAPCTETVTSNMDLLILNCNAIGENPANSLGFNIIPNPTNNQFVISTEDVEEDKIAIRIIGFDGKVVFNREFAASGQIFKTSINTSSFAAGIYTVLVSSKSKLGTSRLIIQH